MMWLQALSTLCFIAMLLVFGMLLGVRFGQRQEPQADPQEHAEKVVPAEADDVDEAGFISVIYDASNPPVQMTLSEDSTKTYLCTCHGRVIRPGDTVVMWPMGEGAPAYAKHLFCSEAMKSLAVESPVVDNHG